ncbi:hypothetical protein PINS_up002703 [Pythium insidiosum]|nr:hypothetical protein PINS_up002703 [Pythium insidiosum]
MTSTPSQSLDAPALRRYLLDDRREHAAKPSAYSPTWRQETHPLEVQHHTLHAKLFAVRYARERLQFVQSPHKTASSSSSSSSTERHPLRITTRVALSACASSEWAHAGGIAALSGAEELFFAFLSPAELVTTSGVCRRWHALARDDRLWEPLLVTPVEQYPLRRLLGLDHVRLPAIHVYAMFAQMLPALVVVTASSDCDVEHFVNLESGARSAAANPDADVDDATSAAARAASTHLRSLYQARSVHLVISDNMSSSPAIDSTSRSRAMGHTHVAARRHGFQRGHQESHIDDDSIEAHAAEDPELIHDNFDYFEHRYRVAPTPRGPALYGAKRMRLRLWLHQQAAVPEPVVRSLVRQLLVAVATLERVGLTHTSISLTSVLVATSVETPVCLSSEGEISRLHRHLPAVDEPPSPSLMPLFQLLCNDVSNLAVVHADDSSARAPTALRLPLPRAIAQMHSPQYMIRSVLGVLRSVWAHNHPRQAPAENADVSWLTLLQRHPRLFSPELRSFIEYAEFVLSQRDATTSQLLQHCYLTGASNGADIVRCAPLEPQDFANEMEYLDRIHRWYAQYGWPSRSREPHNGRLLFRAAAPELVPSTRLGPWSILNALSETRLATQQFMSVVAPSTATSSWVSALARSQGRCLRKLDLSGVDLPMSVLLQELRLLTALTHLRLPREVTRNDNLERFIAELCCNEFLPNLRYMDDDVRPALDVLEAGYNMQLQMVDHLLQRRGTVSKDTMETRSLRVVDDDTERRAGLHSSAPSA